MLAPAALHVITVRRIMCNSDDLWCSLVIVSWHCSDIRKLVGRMSGWMQSVLYTIRPPFATCLWSTVRIVCLLMMTTVFSEPTTFFLSQSFVSPVKGHGQMMSCWQTTNGLLWGNNKGPVMFGGGVAFSSSPYLSLGLMQEPLVRTDLFLSGAYEWFKRTCCIHQFSCILSLLTEFPSGPDLS